MANANYDNVSQLPDINWDTDHIMALLGEGVTFNPADTRVSQVDGTILWATEVEGRYVDFGGRWMGGEAVFPAVGESTGYQVLLVKADDSNDPWPLAYFDIDLGAGPISMFNQGTLILRPVSGDPPLPGQWLQV